MAQFEGFTSGKLKATAVPARFFNELLPLIDDLAELKVVLFSFWALHQKEGDFRYLCLADFKNNADLLKGLAVCDSSTEPAEVLQRALKQAVERGALLQVSVELDSGPEALYFVNTERGREAVRQIAAGEWRHGGETVPVEILPERPNIYVVYEANVGPLTPMIVDEIKDAEAEYPVAWLHEAIHIAVTRNVRNWRYIRAVLERWKREGKSREESGRHSERDGKRYISGEFADWIES